MSRSRTRMRQRQMRLEVARTQWKEALHYAIEQAGEWAKKWATRPLCQRPVYGELWQILLDIVHSGFCVWDIARDIGCDDMERAMISQAIAPNLAGRTHSSVLFRHQKAK